MRDAKGGRVNTGDGTAADAADAADGAEGGPGGKGPGGDKAGPPPRPPSTRWACKLKDGSVVEADRVILATGGLSFPAVGTDGTGHRIAREQLGHSLREPYPALVPLTGPHPGGAQLAGLSLQTVELRCNQGKGGGKKARDAFFWGRTTGLPRCGLRHACSPARCRSPLSDGSVDAPAPPPLSLPLPSISPPLLHLRCRRRTAVDSFSPTGGSRGRPCWTCRT